MHIIVQSYAIFGNYPNSVSISQSYQESMNRIQLFITGYKKTKE